MAEGKRAIVFLIPLGMEYADKSCIIGRGTVNLFVLVIVFIVSLGLSDFIRVSEKYIRRIFINQPIITDAIFTHSNLAKDNKGTKTAAWLRASSEAGGETFGLPSHVGIGVPLYGFTPLFFRCRCDILMR
jgi:hypothetical protein